MSTFLETIECPKCHSREVKWWLSASKQCEICQEVFRSHELLKEGDYLLAYFKGDEIKEIILLYNGSFFVDRKTGDVWNEAILRYLPPRASLGKLEPAVKKKKA